MTDSKTFGAVRDILNMQWNPIAVTLSEDDDEYQDYARYIVEHSPWDEKKLTDYLLYVEHQVIGLSIDSERKVIANAVAKRIVEL